MTLFAWGDSEHHGLLRSWILTVWDLLLLGNTAVGTRPVCFSNEQSSKFSDLSLTVTASRRKVAIQSIWF